MVVYGEGRYRCAEHGEVSPGPRRVEDLEAGRFEARCPVCGGSLIPEAISEAGRLDPRNVYAATKLHQEHLCAAYARESSASVIALRYHNVYGSRMPRDTPYAGVASIFASSLAAGEPPRVYEDGGQLRDFVHVRDVARANVQALTVGDPTAGAFNVASGHPRSILEMAEALADAHGDRAPRPVVTGQFRLGDVRHVFASAEKAREEPRVCRRGRRSPPGWRSSPGLRQRVVGVTGAALLVIAKDPQPGRCKTRLCPPLRPAQAATLAAAALRDTLDVVDAVDAARKILVLDGSAHRWRRPGWLIIPQRGDGLAQRLANAFADVAEPALLIGMDTPQLTPELLREGQRALEDHDAVLGPAHDGGYWSVGSAPRPPARLRGRPDELGPNAGLPERALLRSEAAHPPPAADCATSTPSPMPARPRRRTPGTRFARALGEML